MNRDSSNRLELNLFGGFNARRVGGELIPLTTKKAQAMIAYLAMHPGQAHPRDKIATLFWGDTGEEQARHSLRQTLVGLRRALASADLQHLFHDGEELAFDERLLEVDVNRFRALIREGTPEALSDAVTIYRGDLLEGLHIREQSFEEWLLSEREILWELVLEALSRLLSNQIDRGDPEAAIRTALRLIALDPLQEEVHRTLMRLYAGLGRRGAALKQYDSCRSIFQKELGVGPQPETDRLYRQILDEQHPDPSEGSAEISGVSRATPVSSVLLVEDEPVTQAILEKHLQSGGYRFVSVSDGSEALEALRKNRFDIIVSDINMPNLGGQKMLEAIRKENISTPAMFITALSDDDLEAEFLELGAVDFIRKPIRRDILLLRLRNALRQRRRATDSP